MADRRVTRAWAKKLVGAAANEDRRAQEELAAQDTDQEQDDGAWTLTEHSQNPFCVTPDTLARAQAHPRFLNYTDDLDAIDDDGACDSGQTGDGMPPVPASEAVSVDVAGHGPVAPATASTSIHPTAISHSRTTARNEAMIAAAQDTEQDVFIVAGRRNLVPVAPTAKNQDELLNPYQASRQPYAVAGGAHSPTFHDLEERFMRMHTTYPPARQPGHGVPGHSDAGVDYRHSTPEHETMIAAMPTATTGRIAPPPTPATPAWPEEASELPHGCAQPRNVQVAAAGARAPTLSPVPWTPAANYARLVRATKSRRDDSRRLTTNARSSIGVACRRRPAHPDCLMVSRTPSDATQSSLPSMVTPERLASIFADHQRQWQDCHQQPAPSSYMAMDRRGQAVPMPSSLQPPFSIPVYDAQNLRTHSGSQQRSAHNSAAAQQDRTPMPSPSLQSDLTSISRQVPAQAADAASDRQVQQEQARADTHLWSVAVPQQQHVVAQQAHPQAAQHSYRPTTQASTPFSVMATACAAVACTANAAAADRHEIKDMAEMLTSFSGREDEDVNRWITLFQMHTKTASEHVRQRLLHKLLDGQAREWLDFTKLQRDSKRLPDLTTTELLERLAQRFFVKYSERYQAALTFKRQNLSAAEYTQKKAALVLPFADNPAYDLAQHLVDGLDNPTERLAMARLMTAWEDELDENRLLEKFRKALQRELEYAADETHVMAVTHTTASPAQEAAWKPRLPVAPLPPSGAASLEETRQPRWQPSTSQQARQAKQTPAEQTLFTQAKRYPSNNLHEKGSNNTCYNCGLLGHFFRHCPTRKQRSQRRQLQRLTARVSAQTRNVSNEMMSALIRHVYEQGMQAAQASAREHAPLTAPAPELPRRPEMQALPPPQQHTAAAQHAPANNQRQQVQQQQLSWLRKPGLPSRQGN